MKKTLAVLAITIAGLFSGGVALALTGGGAPHDQRPGATDSSKDHDTSESSESTESSESDESSESSESSESDSSDSDESSESSESDSASSSAHEHPDNHGADVSKAAHECPKGPGHGACVSAVAHTHS